ncbi:amidohydrolase [Nocardioides mangrovi]|uniref:Amidohydrolase family protein n=1 Tax=Nocardioides mangrovi TaxID=2874580 RepID=A0ABS7UET4_9ACTN|nr:amidohydrolase family protein [Nocardioides mangrovi]MBZ5739364.1 amidohydrolase family protein [Nocardioides mangrovi]
MTGSPIPPPSYRVVVGRLRTMDPERPTAEAMAVRDDTIVAVGTRAEVLAACPEGTPVEDLGETCVLPGFIDTHLHLLRGGLKVIHDLGPGPHDADTVVASMRELGFEAEWGEEPPTLEQRVEGMRVFQPALHELGITAVIDPAATRDELAGYQECWRRDLLTLRVVAMPYVDVGQPEGSGVDDAIVRLENVGLGTGFGDDRLRVGGIKVYLDGEGMKSQALLRDPWPDTGEPGVQRIPTEAFQRLLDHCARSGWTVGVHAVGGLAVERLLECYAAADRVASIRGRQWQIIHGYLETAAASMRRAAELDVVMAAQPSIMLRNGAALAELLGPWAERMCALRSWLDAGVRVALGSDGPYFPFDPRELMWSAVTRRVRDREEPLDPAEAITVEEALAAYTREAAVAAFAEGRYGVLAPGLLADWVALDRDPLTIDPMELRDLRVLRTVVGGETVWSA